jgi:hypothetical protein
MFETIFIACMLSNPVHCETVRQAEAFEGANPAQCYKMAQMKIVDFLKEHPGWYIKRYGCQKEHSKDA